jgi:hypothetical protein
MQRPNGNGTSRTKVASVLLGVWSVGARIAGVPHEIVDAGTAVLGGATAWFLRDAR